MDRLVVEAGVAKTTLYRQLTGDLHAARSARDAATTLLLGVDEPEAHRCRPVERFEQRE
jgi:hypothetical protein